MPFANGVEPIKEQLEPVRGSTYKCKILLWEDEAHTKPLSLAGLTARLVIVGYTTLTAGSGLTVTLGQVAVVLTPAQTKNAPAPQLHYYLELEENPEEVVYPVNGALVFSNP